MAAGLKVIEPHQGHGLIGLNAPLKIYCLALAILVPFLNFTIRAVIEECTLQKSCLALIIMKYKACKYGEM